jgi:hypothetical protein
VKIVKAPPITEFWKVEDLEPGVWHAMFGLSQIREWYIGFARQMTSYLPGDSYLYQREPNLRIHPPGELCVPWHRDADLGHLLEEWNVWVPLTETFDDSQRLWIKHDDSGGIEPVRVPLGEAFIFPGARVPHGNGINTTDIARVSFDFRLIEKRYYRDTGAKTVKYGVPLRLGDYWEEMPNEY